jgi:glycosyltransferase involved in cell wall biosynthesis
VTLPGEATLRALPGVEVIGVDIPRKIDPVRDSRAFLALKQLYQRRRFDLVHSYAPKAGLLSAGAGSLAGTRARVHTFTGQVWASRRGPMRALLRAADALTARLATHVLADSISQRDFLVDAGVVRPGQCMVLGAGSVSGVDLERFRPDPQARAAVRTELGVADDVPLVLFLGRLNRDKGVLDLAQAYGEISGSVRAALVLVGPDEGGIIESVRRQAGPSVRYVGYTDAPQRYLAAADLLCLPSYREGFGTVVIEAAAVGVPALASRIYGVVDAVVDGKTGCLFQAGRVEELREKLAHLLTDSALRARLGAAARVRVCQEFAQERAIAALQDFYKRILA